MNISNVLGIIANIAQIFGTVWTIVFGGVRLADVLPPIRKRKQLQSPSGKKNHAVRIGVIIVIASSTAAFLFNGTAIPFSTKEHVATSNHSYYQGTLNDPDAQWDQVPDHCFSASDGYHVIESQHLWGDYVCKEIGYTYQNGTISVDTKFYAGDRTGLLVRVNTNSAGTIFGYVFEIRTDGFYRLSYRGIKILQDWVSSPALRTGYGVTNNLKVI